MATEDPNKEPKAGPVPKESSFAGPVRWKIALNVFLQIFFVGAIFLGANYLGFRHWKIWDRTYNAQYTLGADSMRLLKALDKKIELILIAKKGEPIQKELYQLAMQFRRESDGNIGVRMIDPYKDIQDWQVLSEEAREAKIELGYGIYLRLKKSKDQMVDASHFFVPQSELIKPILDPREKLVRNDFLAETAISSGIMAITRKDKPKIALVSKKGALVNRGGGTAFDILKRLAERQNWTLEPIILQDPTMGRSSSDDIPSDVRALVFLGPSIDLDAGELARLRRYWEGNKSGVLIFLQNQNESLPNLFKFMSENGIQPREDRVLFANKGTGGPTTSVDAIFLDGSPVTRTLAGAGSLLYGYTRSLALLQDKPKVRDENIVLKPLMEAEKNYWGEVSYHEQFPVKDGEDTQPPLYVAASAERGAAKDNLVGIDSSRMIVVANNTMLDPESLQQQNYDFIGASMNWLLHDEKFVGINPKEKQIFRMDLSEGQLGRIRWITTIILPLAVLMLGLAIWGMRRS